MPKTVQYTRPPKDLFTRIWNSAESRAQVPIELAKEGFVLTAAQCSNYVIYCRKQDPNLKLKTFPRGRPPNSDMGGFPPVDLFIRISNACKSRSGVSKALAKEGYTMDEAQVSAFAAKIRRESPDDGDRLLKFKRGRAKGHVHERTGEGEAADAVEKMLSVVRGHMQVMNVHERCFSMSNEAKQREVEMIYKSLCKTYPHPDAQALLSGRYDEIMASLNAVTYTFNDD